MSMDYRPWTMDYYKTRKPCSFRTRLLEVPIVSGLKIGHRPTLPHFTAVPSALAGLTSLFGMGRGGHRRYRHLNFFWLIGSLVHLFISMSMLAMYLTYFLFVCVP